MQVKLHPQWLPKKPMHVLLPMQTSKLVQNNVAMPERHDALRFATQVGFTLLELLIVVALIATLAGVAVLAYDPNGDESVATQLAQSEMTELAKALRQFRRDVGQYPTVAHPADFSPLMAFIDDLDNVSGASMPDALDDFGGYRRFNPDTGRGWHGPYLEPRGMACVQMTSFTPIVNTVGFVYAKLDPFKQQVARFSPRVVWRENNGNACNSTGNLLTERQGIPYLLIDMPNGTLPNPAHPRIVSIGADGVYGGVNTVDTCQPNRTNNPSDPGNDDLVMCL